MELPQHFICSSLGHLLLSASSELFLNLPYLASWTASVSRVGTVVNTCYLPAEGLCTRGYQLAESSPCCLRLCPWILGPAISAPAGWRPGNGAASARAAILETESPWRKCPGTVVVVYWLPSPFLPCSALLRVQCLSIKYSSLCCVFSQLMVILQCSPCWKLPLPQPPVFLARLLPRGPVARYSLDGVCGF